MPHAAEILREAPELFEITFRKAPIALIVIDQRDRIRLFNERAEAMFKYAAAEIVDAPVEILIPPTVRERHGGLVQGYFRDPTPRMMGEGRNLFGINRDGEQIPIEVGLNPIQLKNETLVLASIINMAPQLEQEARFQVAVEAAPNAMVMIDADGHITLVNQQCEDLFQFTRQELIGQPVEILVPEPIRQAHPVLVRRFLDFPEPRAMGTGRDLFAQKKDGTLFPVEVGLRPIETKNGVQVISSIVDITERVNAKKLILARNEELQQFAYRASHDLRAPLISISGLAEFAAEDCAEGRGEDAIASMQRIAALARKLQDFIQDIMALAQADHTTPDMGEFAFEEALQSIRDKLETVIQQRAVRIEYHPGHEQPLRTDARRLNQVLENLVSNAINYASPERDDRMVSITTFNDQRHFHIRISDNGIGIAKSHWPQVFQMFQRFHPDHSAGSGLGLYLVKRYVDQIGGQICFDSSPEGSRFFIQLPLRPGQMPEEAV